MSDWAELVSTLGRKLPLLPSGSLVEADSFLIFATSQPAPKDDPNG